MPEHDPNGAARRPVLKRVAFHTLSGPQPGALSSEEVAELGAQGKLWIFCGEYDARGGETGAAAAADAAHHENGPGVYTVFDAGSWGRGYWRG